MIDDRKHRNRPGGEEASTEHPERCVERGSDRANAKPISGRVLSVGEGVFRSGENSLCAETDGESRAIIGRRGDGFQDIEIRAAVEDALATETTSERSEIVSAARGERLDAKATHVCGSADAELRPTSL